MKDHIKVKKPSFFKVLVFYPISALISIVLLLPVFTGAFYSEKWMDKYFTIGTILSVFVYSAVVWLPLGYLFTHYFNNKNNIHFKSLLIKEIIILLILFVGIFFSGNDMTSAFLIYYPSIIIFLAIHIWVIIKLINIKIKNNNLYSKPKEE